MQSSPVSSVISDVKVARPITIFSLPASAVRKSFLRTV